MKVLLKITAISILIFCISCSNNKDRIIGKWIIEDIDFGKNSNSLIASGVITTEKPSIIVFEKEYFKVLNDSNQILEQNSYDYSKDKIIIKTTSLDTADVEFISINKMNLSFSNKRVIRLIRKTSIN